jgi:hypothetical protein
MAFTDAQKVDLLYKKLFGVAKTETSTNKGVSNESIASPLINRADKIWKSASSIPATAAAVANIVQSYQTTASVQCTADTTSTPISSVYPTWKTNLTDWIPPEFGSTYFVKVYVDNSGASNPASTGTQIFDSGSGGVGEWWFDYQAGVLNFVGSSAIPASLTSSKVIFIAGYRYIGEFGYNVDGSFAQANSSYIQANAAFTFANTANGYFYGVNAQQNTNITSASSYANGAFTAANTKFNSSGGTISGDTTITGNLTVSGNVVYANTITVNLGDNIITLNADLGQSGTPTENSGIEIERGIQPNAQFLWIESAGKWSANNGNTSFYIGSESNGSYANSAYQAANSASSYANGAFAKANSALANTSGTTFDGQLNISGTLRSLTQGGDEGGEIYLDKAVSNTTLAAGITIDVFQNKIRIFENAGTNRGVYIDIANGASAGVGTNLLTPSSTSDSFARIQANAAFNQANTANTLAQAAYDKANTGGGGSGNSFSVIATTPGSGYSNIIATAADSVLTITGESGIVVGLDPTTNKIVIGNMYVGAQDITLDYGTLDYFTDAIRYDYGFVS